MLPFDECEYENDTRVQIMNHMRTVHEKSFVYKLKILYSQFLGDNLYGLGSWLAGALVKGTFSKYISTSKSQIKKYPDFYGSLSMPINVALASDVTELNKSLVCC